MWRGDGEVIQVEARPELIHAAQVYPYDLLQATADAADRATAATGLDFPQVGYTANEELTGGSVVVFLGLEELHGEVENLLQLLPTLQQKHHEICSYGAHRPQLGQWLSAAVEEARQQDFSSAFLKCSFVYYLARVQGFEPEIVSALGTAGGMELQRSFDRGVSLLSWAAFHANSSSSVSSHLRAQVNLNAGYGWLSGGHPDQAIQYFDHALQDADECGSSTQLVLALAGHAEASEQCGDYETALRMLELCRALTQPPPGADVPPDAMELDRMVSLLHGHVSTQQPARPQEVHSWFERLKELLASLLPHVAVSAVVFHLMGIRGGSSALISIGETSFRDVCFNAPTIIGEAAKFLLK
jgi:hypothetical protein